MVKEKDQAACYTAALRLLQYRFRSEQELHDRLHQKGYSDDDVQAVMIRLRDENWLDDRRFAEEFALSLRRRSRGSHRIVRELQALGVNRDDAAAAARSGAGEERQALVAAAQKRIVVLSRLRGLEFVRSAEGRRKLAAYLLRQGYDFGAVFEVVKEELGRR